MSERAGCFFGAIWLALGLIGFNAAVDGIELLVRWLPTFLAYSAGFFLIWFPFVGSALAYYGAAYAWGWHWYWALAVAVPQLMALALLLPVLVFESTRLRQDRRPEGAEATATRGRRAKAVRKIVAMFAISVLAFVIVASIGLAVLRERLCDLNMKRLDAWVNAGGDINTVQSEMVETCGNLVLTQAGWFERIQFLTFWRNELDFSVDVCTKMTANRIYSQQEFERPELVAMVCDNIMYALFWRLCRRSGLRQVNE